MIPDNVTLIVKAPNQQIEDQNVECQSSWTVLQLKGHLSEVYPSKPKTEEQKIIYSGQLLEDKTILKDVLRTYESQIAHTMHLVCTPNKKMAEPVRNNVPTAPVETAPDGVRRRNVETAEPAPRPEMRQNDQNHTVEMQNYISSFVNNYGRVPPYPNYNLGENLPMANDPAMMANHMMMMQQAYLQYMQQYANMWQANQQPAAAPPAVAAPAPAPPAEAEEGGGRDWLDHVYTASRLAILVSLVYLYGSGARLLLVLVLAVAGYLHQIGFFQDLYIFHRFVVDQPAPNQAAANQPAANQPAANQPAANPPAANQPATNRPAENQPDGNQPNPPAEDNHPSLFAITWMVFSSFFASLIPDVI